MTGEHPSGTAAWKQIVIRYQQPSRWRAVWQLVNTLVPYVALWSLMYFCTAVSYWLVVPLAILAGGLMVRLWDEKQHRLVGFGHLRNLRRQNTL